MTLPSGLATADHAGITHCYQRRWRVFVRERAASVAAVVRIALVRPAGLLGVFIRGLNEISDPARAVGIADVEDLQFGVKEETIRILP